MKNYQVIRNLAICTLLLACTLGAAQNNNVSPEEFLDELPANTLALDGNNSLSLANLDLDAIAECNGHVGGLAPGDIMFIYGFARLSAQEYRLMGEQAVSISLERARLNAQEQAARYFEAVVMVAGSYTTTSSMTNQAGGNTESEVGEIVNRTLSTNVINSFGSYNADHVSATLRGGQVVGTKLIVRPSGDGCIGVRYEIPLDQVNFDPTGADNQHRITTPPAATPTAPRTVHNVGNDPLPAGESTSGRF